MAKKFTLDDIAEAAEKKFGATVIEIEEGVDVELVNIVRLPSDKRKELTKLQEKFSEKEDEENEGAEEQDIEESVAEQVEILESMIRTVAKDGADRLIDTLGGDLASLLSVFEMYSKETELGEA